MMGLFDGIFEPGGLMGSGGTPEQQLQRQIFAQQFGAMGRSLLENSRPQYSSQPIPPPNWVGDATGAFMDPRNQQGPLQMAQYRMRAEQYEAEKKRQAERDKARRDLASLMSPSAELFPQRLDDLDISQPSTRPNMRPPSLMGASVDDPRFLAAAMNYSPEMGFSAINAAETRKYREARDRMPDAERRADNARANAYLGIAQGNYQRGITDRADESAAIRDYGLGVGRGTYDVGAPLYRGGLDPAEAGGAGAVAIPGSQTVGRSSNPIVDMMLGNNLPSQKLGFAEYNRRAGNITPAQMANNTEIDTARRMVMNIRRLPGESMNDAIRRVTQKTSDTGRANSDYDPMIEAAVRIARQHKIGGDSEYNSFVDRLGGIGGSAQPVPMGPNGKLDRTRLKAGETYEHNGQRYRFDGSNMIPVD